MSAQGTTSATTLAALCARLVALCSDFKLPTLGTELVPRFERAGHRDVLPLLVEVFELEAQDRLERRIDRRARGELHFDDHVRQEATLGSSGGALERDHRRVDRGALVAL